MLFVGVERVSTARPRIQDSVSMPGRRRGRRRGNSKSNKDCDSGGRKGPSRTQPRVTVTDLQTLFDKRKLSADQWRELGTRSGLEPGKLNEIQYNNAGKPNSSRTCLLDMFDAWLKADKDATLKKFKKALR